MKAEESLLQRQGFCPNSIVIAELERSRCQRRALCLPTYSVKQRWTKNRQDIWLSGKSTIGNDGENGTHATYVNGAFPAANFGTFVEMDRLVSQELWSAMHAAGASQIDPSVAGRGTLFASRVLCSASVIPHPVPGCSMDLETSAADIAEGASGRMHAELLRKRAFEGPENIMGSVNTGLSLVKCSRVVVPGAIARCVGLIENRPASRH